VNEFLTREENFKTLCRTSVATLLVLKFSSDLQTNNDHLELLDLDLDGDLDLDLLLRLLLLR